MKDVDGKVLEAGDYVEAIELIKVEFNPDIKKGDILFVVSEATLGMFETHINDKSVFVPLDKVKTYSTKKRIVSYN
jgi:hypothetical protein